MKNITLNRKILAQAKKHLKRVKKQSRNKGLTNLSVFFTVCEKQRIYAQFDNYVSKDAVYYNGLSLVTIPPSVHTLHTDKKEYLDYMPFKRCYVI